MKLKNIFLFVWVSMVSAVMLCSCFPDDLASGYPPMVVFSGQGGTMTVNCTSSYTWYIPNGNGSNTILLENGAEGMKMCNGWLTVTVCDGGSKLIITADRYENKKYGYSEPTRKMCIQAVDGAKTGKITVMQKLL